MKTEVELKLDIISNIWNDFIWDYPICRKQINFTQEAESNYFGDILGYFRDTFDIIFDKKLSKDYPQRFASHISFLQAIYIQQDFIEEMLILFKTGVDKGNLKKDENYSINREIRNELVGHPIRKFHGKVISSALFGYNSTNETISYLRYHSENNFEFEDVNHEIKDILNRHILFLIKYFEVIIQKLEKVLSHFRKELEKMQTVSKTIEFEKLIKLLSVKYEFFLNNTFLYDKISIIKVFEKRKIHKRYATVISEFNSDLESSLKEKIKYSKSVFEIKIPTTERIKSIKPIISFENGIVKINVKKKPGRKKIEYGYELGKLATKRNYHDFKFFSGTLKSKTKNKVVLDELLHMENNLYDDVEYLSSYILIRKILKS